MRSRTRRNRGPEAGYNLVETLVALAMTGMVILSIMTLFFLGRKNVYSGKQMSAANAVATRVLEDLSMMSSLDIRSNFGIDDSTTLATNTLGGKTFANSVLRASNGTVDSTTDPSGYMARWQTLVTSADFANGRVAVVITPANPLDSDAPVTTAQVIRVDGVVEWNEGRRRRSVTFSTPKLQRP